VGWVELKQARQVYSIVGLLVGEGGFVYLLSVKPAISSINKAIYGRSRSTGDNRVVSKYSNLL
jgi:hypothetical protein